MPITSSTSFYCRQQALRATFHDLGEPDLGAVVNINDEDSISTVCSFFFDDVAYAARLAAAINKAAEEQPKVFRPKLVEK